MYMYMIITTSTGLLTTKAQDLCSICHNFHLMIIFDYQSDGTGSQYANHAKFSAVEMYNPK